MAIVFTVVQDQRRCIFWRKSLKLCTYPIYFLWSLFCNITMHISLSKFIEAINIYWNLDSLFGYFLTYKNNCTFHNKANDKINKCYMLELHIFLLDFCLRNDFVLKWSPHVHLLSINCFRIPTLAPPRIQSVLFPLHSFSSTTPIKCNEQQCLKCL